MQGEKLGDLPVGFGELLLEWRRLAMDKLWAGLNDCSWWYGERASVSQLAGAAWTLGGWAMQDYGWMRGENNSHALIDLCVEHTGRDLRFIAEAKQIWPRLDGHDVVGKLENALTETRNQLAGIPRDDWDRVSLVFIAPWLYDLTNIGAATEQFIKLLCEIKGAGVVWTFPPWALEHDPYENAYYPGVALVARRERARRRR